jgi:hypothetical protein
MLVISALLSSEAPLPASLVTPLYAAVRSLFHLAIERKDVCLKTVLWRWYRSDRPV